MAGEDVYCTLVTSDAYLPGAAVLAHSLRDAGTQHKLACLITQDSLRASTVTELQSLYNYVIPVDRIGNPSPANLYLMNRPDLLYTFTKIHLWRLTQFRKIIYLDADVVALRAPDELFDTKEAFAAAPDVGWPDAFNTGVMVLSPSEGDFNALRTLAQAGDSFDGADQGLLNQYFEHRPWKRLSFTYNCTPSGNYQYEPAYRYYKRDIKLVHFIGKDKPWQEDRHVGGGVHAELLGRWWSVYDRHFNVSTYEYTSTGRREPVRHDSVQREAKSETQTPAYYATGYPASSTAPAPPPTGTAPPRPNPTEPPSASTEVPFAEDPQPRAEALDQGHLHPTPTHQQRKFSAPHLEWDATRAAPPQQSRPEASNFPQQIEYEFSSDPQPFRPPAAYPEPPRDMWYEVPSSKPKPLPSIFPWEMRGDRKATRVFAEDAQPQPPAPVVEEEDEFRGGDELEVSADDNDFDKDVRELEAEVATGAFTPKTPTSTWEDFGRANKNAWDEVVGIEEYVRQLTAFQKNKGGVQVVAKDHPAPPPTVSPALAKKAQHHVLSPSNEMEPAELVEKVKQRRESLILTDFPSASERPSLPVTPAPRRRTTFWGQENGREEEDLAEAEGVPEQSEWNPDNQLEQLRRNSLLSPDNLKLPSKDIPRRKMPGTAITAIPEVVVTDGTVEARRSSLSGNPVDLDGVLDAAQKNAAKAAPTFSEPVFSGTENGGVGVEEVLSPTESSRAGFVDDGGVRSPTEEEKSRVEAVAEAS